MALENLDDRSASPDATGRVAIVGGGVSALAAAHRMAELAPGLEVTLLEASDRLGGILETVELAGYLIERGPDMFTTKEPWALELCRRIGFDRELIGVNPSHRQALVVKRGKLYPVPGGFSLMSPTRFWPIARTPLLSPAAKLRLALEPAIPRRRGDEDESLAEFARRRLGKQVYERLVQPVVGGIYTADPERLSMRAALSQFVEMEQRHGSLLRASWAARSRQSAESRASGARYQLFVAPREGMSSLVQAISARLGNTQVRRNCRVTRLTREAEGWRLDTEDGAPWDLFQGVILACGARQAAELARQEAPQLASELAAIEHASTVVVARGYRRQQIAHPLNAFGVVTPLVEQRKSLAISFSSVKFAGRAPDGEVLLRVFIGGACQPELNDRPDEELRQIADQELAELLGIRGEPVVEKIVRWRNAMPQYHVGHLDRVNRIESLVNGTPALALACNALRGVGIPFCVRAGEAAAERIVAQLSSSCAGQR